MKKRLLRDWPEDELVAHLLRDFAVKRPVEVGPGDDCAVVRSKTGPSQLLKTDCLIEDIHFLRSHSAAAVGWKAVARAVSDFAAMAGHPECLLLTVAVPEDLPLRYLQGIYGGVAKAVRTFGLQLAGGETSRSPGPIFLNVALTGAARPGPILRSGARPGNRIFVTGRLGGSFASGWHLRFQPRLSQAWWLARLPKALRPTAMMDLSDGLGSDLPRLAAASGCEFLVEEAALPLRRGFNRAAALRDGEDYELLFTVPRGAEEELGKLWRTTWPGLNLTCLGQMTPPGQGRLLSSAGFAHFQP